MGRAEEIAKVEADLQAVAARRAKIAENYTAFASRISAQIEKILKDAEVYDVIRALEVGREKRRADDQAQADALGQQLEELAKLREALLNDQTSGPTVDGTPPTA